MKRVHFLHAAEHQFLQVRIIVFHGMAKFYGGPAMFIVTCFLAQLDCRMFLSERCNTIKQQLRG